MREMLQALSVSGGDAARSTAASILWPLPACLLPEGRLRSTTAFGAAKPPGGGCTSYDREEIADGLGLSRQQTGVMADSEVLLAAWLRWHEECVDHLSGAFSFAVWNQDEQHLFWHGMISGSGRSSTLPVPRLCLRIDAEGAAWFHL